MTMLSSASRPPLFRLLGVPIHIDGTWLLFALFIGFQVVTGDFPELDQLPNSATLVLAILLILGLSASILLHEMAHTLAGRAMGMSINRITLHLFGGVAELSEEPRTPVSELVMALAGPILSVVLGIGMFLLLPVLGGMHAPIPVMLAVEVLAQVNLVLAAFNMIPAFPLDGGRVLRSLVWLFTRKLGLATRIAAVLGQVFGGLMMAYGVYSFAVDGYATGIWNVVLGAIIMRMAAASRRAAPIDPTYSTTS
ncbi:hypothetical protein BH11PSE2_BH11PSE2_06760 [soil metagenome]